MTMIDAAIRFHEEGLCVVPVKPRDKKVALETWTEFQTRQSTPAEIALWWRENPNYNIGIMNGFHGYVTVDIDHDLGIYRAALEAFPALASGRIEQSGSGQGYHIPLLVKTIPNFGMDSAKKRVRGSRVWKTPGGNFNIRTRWCITVAPPSIHPSGGQYIYLQNGDIAQIDHLEDLIAWLNKLDPRFATKPDIPRSSKSSRRTPLKEFYPSILDAIELIGIVGDRVPERGGDLRIRGNGGLIVNEDGGYWYCFEDEMGGDVVDLFGWKRFGPNWNKTNPDMYRVVATAMEEMAGIGKTRAPVRTPNIPRRSMFGTTHGG